VYDRQLYPVFSYTIFWLHLALDHMQDSTNDKRYDQHDSI